MASVAFVSPSSAETTHERIKGVITRRLQKVGQAPRYRLRKAMDSRDRPEFDAVFDLLVAQQHLVTVEGDEALWRLANPVTKAAEAAEGGEGSP